MMRQCNTSREYDFTASPRSRGLGLLPLVLLGSALLGLGPLLVNAASLSSSTWRPFNNEGKLQAAKVQIIRPSVDLVTAPPGSTDELLVNIQFTAFGRLWRLEFISSPLSITLPTSAPHHNANSSEYIRQNASSYSAFFTSSSPFVHRPPESAASSSALFTCVRINHEVKQCVGAANIDTATREVYATFYWGSRQYFLESVAHRSWKRSDTPLHRIYHFITPPVRHSNATLVKHTSERSSEKILHLRKTSRCGTTSDGGVIPTSGKFSGRSKRHSAQEEELPVLVNYVSEENIVELLIVASSELRLTFGSNLHRHILMNMALASSLLRQPMIKNSIKISIVGILEMNKQYEVENDISTWNDTTHVHIMRRFCEWAKNSGYRYDSALLWSVGEFTGRTLGVAMMSSMCNQDKNCIAVVDRGMGTGFTIAHEIGHQLGASHDSYYEGRECTKTPLSPEDHSESASSIMSEALKYEVYPRWWGLCASHSIAYFLRSPHARCLREWNSPHQHLSPERIHQLRLHTWGEDAYNLHHQCTVLMKKPSEFCGQEFRPCGQLHCRLYSSDATSGCYPTHASWAEGTPCDAKGWKVCHLGACVPRDARQDMDGQWGAWGAWSRCSRECDGGVQFRSRECDNPRPKNGGHYCLGDINQMRSCNTHVCSRKINSRQLLCDELGRKAGLQLSAYIPHFNEDSEHCTLKCVLPDGMLYPHNLTLVDGTPCSPYTTDICVHAACWPTGCDRILGSQKKVDMCGRCDGRNESCRLEKDVFRPDAYSKKIAGMFLVLRLPPGASNVLITKISTRAHRFNAKYYDDYILVILDKGGISWRIRPSREYFKGAPISYSGSCCPNETLRIEGRVHQGFTVLLRQIDSRQDSPPPKVQFEYYTNSPEPYPPSSSSTGQGNNNSGSGASSEDVSYEWQFLNETWTSCHNLCTGVSLNHASCMRISQSGIPTAVEAKWCLDAHTSPPPHRRRNCQELCPYRWRETVPPEGMETRSRGDLSSHPHQPVDNRWGVGNTSNMGGEYSPNSEQYSSCSARCGSGWRAAHYICESRPFASTSSSHGDSMSSTASWSTVQDALCIASGLEKPAESVTCEGKCLPVQWRVSSWSQCSSQCGRGQETRRVWCEDLERVSWPQVECHAALGTEAPPEQRTCETMAACSEEQLRWQASEWSACSAWCGEGRQNRAVRCVKFEQPQVVEDALCEKWRTKPRTQRTCETRSCLSWKITNYTECSVSCGEGIRSAVYHCWLHVNATSERLTADEACVEANISKPAATHEVCELSKCPEPFWFTVSWKQCSATCGEGVTRRLLTCALRTPNGAIWPAPSAEMCEHLPKPEMMEKCRLLPCPKWTLMESWSECHGMSMFGEQERVILCKSENDQILPVSACEDKVRPPMLKRKCLLETVPAVWKVGPWSNCSTECGFGYMTRNVSCVLVNGLDADSPEKCSSSGRRPTEMMECYVKNCDSAQYWMVFQTAECKSPSGNEGILSRFVFCVEKHRIHDEKQCQGIWRPNEEVPCFVRDEFHWFIGPWPQCEEDRCGSQSVTRLVQCQNLLGQPQPSWKCDISTKPAEEKLCTSSCDGYPRTCKEAKKLHRVTTDGEYKLNVANQLVQIYCKDMSNEDPQEYLTLPRPNHASSSMYLLPPNELDTCPASSGEVDRQNCPTCDIVQRLFTSTRFWRVRLHIHTLQVDIADFNFSYTYGQSRMFYGTAKDCFGSPACPQGNFRIDLRDTGFTVSPETQWLVPGRHDGAIITRDKFSETITGYCGGHCAGCIPYPGLFLEPANYRFLRTRVDPQPFGVHVSVLME